MLVRAEYVCAMILLSQYNFCYVDRAVPVFDSCKPDCFDLVDVLVDPIDYLSDELDRFVIDAFFDCSKFVVVVVAVGMVGLAIA